MTKNGIVLTVIAVLLAAVYVYAFTDWFHKESIPNKYPTALWHLITDSNSVPIKALMYGQAPKGMKPAVPRTRPEALLPDVDYVLMLEAGSIKAQTNFHTAQAVASGK